MLRGTLLSILLLAVSSCALLSPLAPRGGERQIAIRLRGSAGEIPEWAHLYVGTQGQRVHGGGFVVGIPRDGVRVIRLMSPHHEPITLPILDRGRDVSLEVKLGRPSLLDAVTDAQIVSRHGNATRFSRIGDGRYAASVTTADLRDGVHLVGATAGAPMSLNGAAWYEATPQGTYWSQFDPDPRHWSIAVTFEPAQLRSMEADPVVAFDDPEQARLYEIVRWRDTEHRELLNASSLHALGAFAPQKLLERLERRFEALARHVARQLEIEERGVRRQLWLLSALDLLRTPSHRAQVEDHAAELAREVPASSELWSLYPGVAQVFSHAAWRCCREYVRALSEHPDRLVSGDALFVIVVLGSMDADDSEAREAFARLERLHPDAAETGEARRLLSATRRGERPPALRLYQVEDRSARVSLRAFEGKTVLLHFWATWAQGSKQAFEALRQVEEVYRARGLEVLNVSLDQDRERLRRFLSANRAQLPGQFAVIDPRDRDALAAAHGIADVPTLVLIGRDGAVAATRADLLREGLAAPIERALRGSDD